ncbi:MAG: hypothetical protein CL878_14630 [Dehalococcoidia bacterium]|nr:hypothetical protein [Dehalococcoidia bacterium]
MSPTAGDRPVHAHWCAQHQRYYRGRRCPLCREGPGLSNVPIPEQQKKASNHKQGPVYRAALTLVTPDLPRLRTLRRRRGWAQHDLSRAAGVRYEQLVALDTGAQTRITLETAELLATALGVSLGAVAQEVPEGAA